MNRRIFNDKRVSNRYQLEQLLGTGGMGTVYRGTDLQSGQPVAIKFISPEKVADQPGMIERLFREAEALRALNHPNIVRILATGEENSGYYIVMEFLPGGSLRDILKRSGQLTIWGTFQYPSWVGDNVQLGSDRPYLKSILIFGEQLIRVVLALILLERFQINALIIAYFVGLFSKGIAAYLVNHKVCFPQRFFIWQSLIAPLLAAGVQFAWLRWLTGLIWQGDEITSVVIFLIGILPSFPVYMLLYGLFGGWDRDTLEELKNAVTLTGFAKPLVWLVWKSTELGTRISPLHNRFPIDIRTAAMQEAQDLTAEKVKL